MTTGTLVSVEEYLHTTYRPNCEFVDGVLFQKPMPTWMHAKLPLKIAKLIEAHFSQFEVAPGTYTAHS